jgi:uncharacterized protein (DUF4415 family)
MEPSAVYDSCAKLGPRIIFTIFLDSEVLESLESNGRGRQTRINRIWRAAKKYAT